MSDKAKRHAPRGPILNKDPMASTDRMGRCSARSKQSGKPCKQYVIPGGTVCHYHGGGAPQVKAKAMERLLALQHPAIDRLAKLIDQETFPTVAYAASRDILDRTIGKPAEQQNVEHSGTITIKHELG